MIDKPGLRALWYLALPVIVLISEVCPRLENTTECDEVLYNNSNNETATEMPVITFCTDEQKSSPELKLIVNITIDGKIRESYGGDSATYISVCVKRGQNISASCYIDNNYQSDRRAEWTRVYDNKTFQNPLEFYNIEIESINPHIYNCTHGDDNETILILQVSIEIQYEPIVRTPTVTYVKEGAGLEIACNVSAVPNADIGWIHPDGHITKGSLLVFKSINKAQHGVYVCNATNYLCDGKNGTSSSTSLVDIYYKPKVVSLKASSNVTAGDIITLNCTADSSNPAPVLRWYRNNELVDTSYTNISFGNLHEYQTEYSGFITTQLVNITTEPEDNGCLFRCFAQNEKFDDKDGASSKNVSFNVYYKPFFVNTTIKSKESGRRDTHLFICKVNGNPVPNIEWYDLADRRVTSIGTRRIETTEEGNVVTSVLTMEDVSRHHHGNFVCRASNNLASTSHEFSIGDKHFNSSTPVATTDEHTPTHHRVAIEVILVFIAILAVIVIILLILVTRNCKERVSGSKQKNKSKCYNVRVTSGGEGMRMYNLVQTCDSPSDMQSFQNHEPSRTQRITTTEQHSEISRRSSQTSDSSDDEYVNLKTPLYAVPNKMKKQWKIKDEKRASAHYENLPPVDDCKQEFFLFQQEQGHIASNSFPKLEDMHAVGKRRQSRHIDSLPSNQSVEPIKSNDFVADDCFAAVSEPMYENLRSTESPSIYENPYELLQEPLPPRRMQNGSHRATPNNHGYNDIYIRSTQASLLGSHHRGDRRDIRDTESRQWKQDVVTFTGAFKSRVADVEDNVYENLPLIEKGNMPDSPYQPLRREHRVTRQSASVEDIDVL